ncbi:MAG: ATP-binding cassette domain-containing protein [Methanomicrobiales archaeon]|nr:ATP-binding cassette domain-containing protein [Methanomicrobiales archaeon]
MRLCCSGVRLTRGRFDMIADGVFEPGIHLVSGRIGSGKSTLAHILAGVRPPAAGVVSAEGITTTGLLMQFSEYHVTAPTVAGEIRSWGPEPEAILAETGLTGREGDHPLRLSRGELRRLHLACMLAQPWDLLILDEPFSALDGRQKELLCRRLEQRPAGIVIIMTHEPLHLPACDMLWEIVQGTLMYRGRIPDALPAWDGAPSQVRSLLDRGVVPENITPAAIREARCRIRG